MYEEIFKYEALFVIKLFDCELLKMFFISQNRIAYKRKIRSKLLKNLRSAQKSTLLTEVNSNENVKQWNVTEWQLSLYRVARVFTNLNFITRTLCFEYFCKDLCPILKEKSTDITVRKCGERHSV